MAGREQISARKIQNLGLGRLEKACTEIANKVMSTEHPLSIKKIDEESMHELTRMSTDERKEYLITLLNFATFKGLTRLINEMNEVPTRHLPTSISMLLDRVRDIQGEPTQRVEVNKKGFTDKQWEELLLILPKEADKEEKK